MQKIASLLQSRMMANKSLFRFYVFDFDVTWGTGSFTKRQRRRD